ncbi:hypothetical protein V8F20_001336 [Naviculisporaceae sp. PSN 640]
MRSQAGTGVSSSSSANVVDSASNRSRILRGADSTPLTRDLFFPSGGDSASGDTGPGVASRCLGENPSSIVGKAVYLITNDNANAVVALRVRPKGLVSPGTVTAANGVGSVALDSDNQPATPDALVMIFAVNADSKTLSRLSISPSDPTSPSLVGTLVPVPGEFPKTAAASAKNCSYALACLAQRSAVFAAVKGDPSTNKTGFFPSFPVVHQQKVTAPAKGRTAAVLSVNRATGVATVVGKGTVDGQKATCWATMATGTAFVTDVGVNRIVEMSLEDARVIYEPDISANGYQAAVTVVDVSGGGGNARQVQHCKLEGMAGNNAMGMAVPE